MHDPSRLSLRCVWTLVLAGVLASLTTPVGAGEFKISRYIEPNQMSNLFTRHVRKGIIKRIGLTKPQLHQIRDTIDPYRETLLEQITDLKDARIEVVEAVTAEPFDADRVRAGHRAAMSKELELTLTAGRIIQEIRPLLTEEQLREIAEMMEEIRVSSELRFADFADKLATGQLLGLDPQPAAR